MINSTCILQKICWGLKILISQSGTSAHSYNNLSNRSYQLKSSQVYTNNQT